jgi:hypothetical protein
MPGERRSGGAPPGSRHARSYAGCARPRARPYPPGRGGTRGRIETGPVPGVPRAPALPHNSRHSVAAIGGVRARRSVACLLRQAYWRHAPPASCRGFSRSSSRIGCGPWITPGLPRTGRPGRPSLGRRSGPPRLSPAGEGCPAPPPAARTPLSLRGGAPRPISQCDADAGRRKLRVPAASPWPRSFRVGRDRPPPARSCWAAGPSALTPQSYRVTLYQHM